MAILKKYFSIEFFQIIILSQFSIVTKLYFALLQFCLVDSIKKKKNKICQNSKQILEKLFFVHSKNKVENLSFFLLKFSDINIKNVGGPLAVVSVYKVV